MVATQEKPSGQPATGLIVEGRVRSSTGLPLKGASIRATLQVPLNGDIVNELLGETVSGSGGAFSLTPSPSSVELSLAAHIAEFEAGAAVVVDVVDHDGRVLVGVPSVPVRNGRAEVVVEVPADGIPKVKAKEIAARASAASVRTFRDLVTAIGDGSGGKSGFDGMTVHERVGLLESLAVVIAKHLPGSGGAEPLLAAELAAVPFDGAGVARSGVARTFSRGLVQVEKLGIAPDTSTRGYRDYLRRIYTEQDAPAKPDRSAELTRRFHQDFKTTDETRASTNSLLVPIVEAILVAPQPYGFNVAAAAVDPGQDASAAAYHTAKTMSARVYLDHLIGLSGLSAEKVGKEFRIPLDLPDSEASTPIDLNIATLQGWYRDSIQAGPEPSVALYPDSLAGFAPFFLEYEEWIQTQQPTFLANSYPLRACRLTDVFGQPALRDMLAKLQPSQNGYADVQWVLSLAEVDDELQRGHDSFAQGEYAAAISHYRQADRMISDRVPRFTPGVTHASFLAQHRSMLSPSYRVALWPLIGTGVEPTWGSAHPNVDPNELLGAFVNRFGYEAASAYVQCCCIPVFIGDVLLAMGRHHEAVEQYGRVTRFAVGAADISTEAGWPGGPVYGVEPGALYAGGALPYTSATESGEDAYGKTTSAGIEGDSPYIGPEGSAPQLTTWLIPKQLAAVERELFSLRHAEALLEWADNLYRQDTPAGVERARELYKACLWLWGEEPPYVAHWEITVPTFQPPGWIENPAVVSQKTRARLRLAQIDSNLNWFGFARDTVPSLRYGALLAPARGMTSLARAAEQDLLAYLNRIEEEWVEVQRATEAVQRAGLQIKVAAQQTAIAADELVQANFQLTLANKAVAAKEAEIASHDSITGQFTDFFDGWKSVIDSASGIPDDQKKAAGEALLSSTFEGEGLYGLGAGPTVMLGYGAATAISVSILESMAAADQGRREELNFLSDKMVPAAQAAVDAKTREQAIGKMQEAIVSADAALANTLLRFEQIRTLSIDFFASIATLRRRMMRRYLDLAARYGWLAERALAFETDRAIDVVRLDYWPAALQGITGADMLTADLAELEAVRLDAAGETVPVRVTLSLARDFPLAFGRLKSTGNCEFRTTEQSLRVGYPGLFGYRIRSVGVQPQSFVVSTPPRGVLTNLGTSLVSRADGTTHVLARPSDAEAVSEFRIERDMALYGLPGDTLLAFEGGGFETVWRLELPLAANVPDLSGLIDVLVTFDLEARYSSTLADTHHAVAEPPTTRMAVAAASALDPKGLGELGSTPQAPVSLSFPLDTARLPIGEKGRTIANAAVLVGGVAGELHVDLKASGATAALTLKDGLALSDSPPLPAQTPRSPFLPLIGKPVDQLFQLTFDPAKNPHVDFGDISDILLALDYAAQI